MGGYIEIIVPTAITAAVGIVVKALFDLLKKLFATLKKLEEQLTNLTAGVQSTMRTDLIHLYEKYTTRGWITPEELSAWHDMHEKYSKLDANGLIDSYGARLDALPVRVID